MTTTQSAIVPTGINEVKGVIKSINLTHGIHGEVAYLKMFIDCGDYLLYGTPPYHCWDRVGDKVSFMAKTIPSSENPKFGFFKSVD